MLQINIDTRRYDTIVQQIKCHNTRESRVFWRKEIVILHTPNTIDDIIQETLDHKKSITSMINDYKNSLKKEKER